MLRKFSEITALLSHAAYDGIEPWQYVSTCAHAYIIYNMRGVLNETLLILKEGLLHYTLLEIFGEIGAHDGGDMIGCDFLHVVLYHNLDELLE